ncbi:hypothetical protein BCV69DRAFT_213157 [Microstroma glucosiphilum]|uniref:Uncharacterized protein n=1 Tax=Pseudomicrostroma glucosiphilum TaxID=1684307 RepID=A0A316U3N3_9BASI|nr:hypothetical protein BCV69DRAFT_213157 [Pseudomicrostroma glucosiphilum]PWN19912.1 hypothetical protein BCV69DRAFT_213157 [Pseudomicrostroma glucosiphilum]
MTLRSLIHRILGLRLHLLGTTGLECRHVRCVRRQSYTIHAPLVVLEPPLPPLRPPLKVVKVPCHLRLYQPCPISLCLSPPPPPRRSFLSSLLRTDPPPCADFAGRLLQPVNWHGLLWNTPRAPEGLAEMPEEPQKGHAVQPSMSRLRLEPIATIPPVYMRRASGLCISSSTIHLFDASFSPLQRLPSNPLSASLSPRESRISRLTGPEIPAAH